MTTEAMQAQPSRKVKRRRRVQCAASYRTVAVYSRAGLWLWCFSCRHAHFYPWTEFDYVQAREEGIVINNNNNNNN